MREKENFFIRILRKLGFIVEQEKPDQEMVIEMCNRAVASNVCPGDCDRCAWGMMRSN